MTGESDDPDGKAPVAIFVLDRLNCAIDDFERGRQNLISYLKTLPGTLESPAEIMLLNNNSMEMVQGYTRKTPDLISAV